MELLPLWIVIGVVVLIAIIIGIWYWATYNGLTTLGVRVDEAWSDITVQLKRRADLIPNLVSTVQGYAAHERGVFENVAAARQASLTATTPVDAAKADGVMQSALKSLFAVAEAYPQLQASQNFLQLQAELTDTEDKIQAARRFYNGNVRDLNTAVQVFPGSLVASVGHFHQMEYFQLDAAEASAVKEPVAVKF